MHHKLLFVIIIVSFLLANCNNMPEVEDRIPPSYEGKVFTSKDTLKILHTGKPPKIDGRITEKSWNNSPWYPLNQVWIPYGEVVSDSVYSGRYKVLWSEKENLLYVLAEIKDNVFVGGHKYDPDPVKGRGYANFDILEIFIDEDNVRGRHVFDGRGENIQQWGENAENAFAYHLTIDTPQENQTVTDFNALDIAGVSWDDYYIANYREHIPEFAVKKSGNTFTWELSLKVFNDNYDPSVPEESRADLQENKVMGFSLAYCNNDDLDETDPQRDHFFGSVHVPEKNYNDHWMDSEYFGTIILKK